VFFIVCLVLQSTMTPAIAIAGIQPDLMLVALCYFTLKNGALAGVYVGFFVGLCQDVYSPVILGQSAFAKTVTGFLVGQFNDRVMNTGPIVKLIILVCAFLVHDSLFSAIDVAKHNLSTASLFLCLLTKTLPRIVYSLVVAALLYLWDTYIKNPLRR
jgi:rod shape-determining protein MreD